MKHPVTIAEQDAVHAMDGGLVRGAWPPIRDAELEGLAGLAPALSAPLHVRWSSPRPFSAAALVHCAAGELFVKRHDPRVRDVPSLLEEHRFASHLRTNNLCVPQVLTLVDPSGAESTARLIDGWTYEVHAPAAGIDLYQTEHSWTPVRCVGHARALGRALAQLHRAAQGYSAPARRRRPLLAGFELMGAADLAGALDRYLRERPVVARFLGVHGRAAALGALAPWHGALGALLAQLEPLWVHNDWHASNAFWSDAGESAQVRSVVDFGLCNLGCAVADLATALERNTIAWLALEGPDDRVASTSGAGDAPAAAPIAHLPLALALLQGYESVRPLRAAERQALPRLLPVVHAEYALSEVDYFCSVVDNARDAALAFPGFLIGHVRWFEEPEGRAYLEGLRLGLAAAERGQSP